MPSVDTILSYFYNAFDFALDSWTAFFVKGNWFKFLITFIVIFIGTKYLILPMIGGRIGKSDSVKIEKGKKDK